MVVPKIIYRFLYCVYHHSDISSLIRYLFDLGFIRLFLISSPLKNFITCDLRMEDNRELLGFSSPGISLLTRDACKIAFVKNLTPVIVEAQKLVSGVNNNTSAYSPVQQRVAKYAQHCIYSTKKISKKQRIGQGSISVTPIQITKSKYFSFVEEVLGQKQMQNDMDSVLRRRCGKSQFVG
ncbi:hypothetical protein PHYBLDRAFT_64645 [Phycomyces blakesleeanus NRRL 1555(-)]|uniref:Uncharacterized protein n=1 Tax=Phycomyces blakesleeanus (strain ATCC 8743b / DSM 1359 / FGSC 10004 / NBRC 33097 / NRRL 1555) TaxID=763407 RepID=A0A162UAN3_PHYB8|nr:hypothetical protein PHYBLDRAFT_64645 [Phycomyces blakesleeanus NRRL 1555(-)]OAD73683.1 hypothetical protein PHYBLDRAFT_64645 [Phycomyces blakesleeanus NRRL 1555(-)]|eukprot:XP_018291723.1 hypothetical protein PHYBLDRAFT_64645 [Phycomyces blakesleeanus NRRL 1555(-)]